MKRFAALIMTVAFLLSMTACATESPVQTEATVIITEAPAVSADMQALYAEMEKTLPDMIVMDEAMMLNFCGIHAEDCVQVIAAICTDGLITDEVWLIEAKDAEALERLTALAETRLQMKGEESITYSPEQYAVVQKAQIVTVGMYMALIVSPDVDTLVQNFNTAVE